MKRNFLIVWSLVLWSAFVASGARGDSRLPFEEDTHSGTTFYRGHLSVDGHDSSFSQCNTGDTYESIDRTGGELLQVYRELAYEPGAKVYVEVSGRQDQLSEGLNKLTILKLQHAALETRGCDEDLQGFSFRAAGNEPFWNIVVTTKRILFSEMDKPEIIFPTAIPPVSDNHLYYIAETAGPSPQRLSIDLREKQCRDTMSGAFYSFTAHVRLRNRVFTGCARQGRKQNRFMTEADLKNAEYSSEWSSIGKVRLKNGTYKEKIVPDSATELVIRIGNIFAFGDLDHDGVNEAVAILITDGGGSGTFYDLIVLKNCKGIPKHVATASLGDRVRVQSLSVQSGHILLEMIVHGPDDPMASPSLRMWKKYRLQEDQLMKVEND